jgi:hypothetical protein
VSVTVNLPPGCSSLRMQDGTRYSGREGGHVTVADEHAPHVRREIGGDAGLVGHGSMRVFLGTRDGKWCASCRFLAQKWAASCPRCGGPVIPEAEMPAAPASMMPSACVVPIAPMG